MASDKSKREAFRVDMTKGSIIGHLLRFSLPILLQNFIQNLYSMADSFWLGRLVGPNALGAVSITFPVTFALISFTMGFFQACSILIAQYSGAGDYAGMRRSAKNMITLTFLSGILCTILGIVFARPLLQLVQTPEENLGLAHTYLNIIFAGMVFQFGYNMVGGLLRGLGDSRTPMWFGVFAAILNIVLDPIFIADWGLNMGVAGAAWATILSQAVSFVVSVIYLMKRNEMLRFTRLSQLGLDRDLLGRIVKLGMPTSIQQTLLSFSFMINTALINGYGSLVVNAGGISGRIEGFAFMPAMAISMAVSTVAGQNLGVKQFSRALETLIKGVIFAVAINTAVVLLFELFAPQIVRIFLSESALRVFHTPGDALTSMLDNPAWVAKLGAEVLRFIAWSYIPFAAMFVINGFINGSGGTFFTMVVSLVSIYALRIPAALLLSNWFGMNQFGVYAAIYIAPFTSVVAGIIYVAQGRWRRSLLTPE